MAEKTNKQKLYDAVEIITKAEDLIEQVRSQMDMDGGENSHSDLDVALSAGVLRNLQKAKNELLETLLKFKGRKMTVNFPHQLSGTWGRVSGYGKFDGKFLRITNE